jgi:hypothetical protein
VFSFRLSLHLFQVRLGANREECFIEALPRGSDKIAYAKCIRRPTKVLVLQNDEKKVREKRKQKHRLLKRIDLPPGDKSHPCQAHPPDVQPTNSLTSFGALVYSHLLVRKRPKKNSKITTTAEPSVVAMGKRNESCWWTLTSDAVRHLQRAGGLQPRACRYIHHLWPTRSLLEFLSTHVACTFKE